MNPAEDMITHINSLIPTWIGGTNIFASKVRAPRSDVPTNAVFVFAGPGRRPERAMSHSDELRRPVVTVDVRNARQKEGSDQAQAILNTLMGTVPTGYLDMTGPSAPTDDGYDSDGRHVFSMSFVLAYLET